MTEADGSASLVAPACYSGLSLKLVRGDGLENACPEGCRSEKPDLIEISFIEISFIEISLIETSSQPHRNQLPAKPFSEEIEA